MRPEYTLDAEIYRNYTLFRFELVEAPHTVVRFFAWPSAPLDTAGLEAFLQTVTIYTFNGINYDVPILTLALTGASCELLKLASDDIIVNRVKWWEFYRKMNLYVPTYLDHVDLMEVAPGVGIGLKMYMGRMHAPMMQDLPIAHDSLIEPVQRVVLDAYCGNDHQGTRMMRGLLDERLQLRRSLTDQYGVDVRSKSDAQIAEAVIKAELSFKPNKRTIRHGYSFRYEAPGYIEFVTPEMKALLDRVHEAEFVVEDKEQAIALGVADEETRTGVVIPPSLAGLDIHLGQSVYRMGIGGLHSQESRRTLFGGDAVRKVLRDADVASYYPSLILGAGMTPQQLGPEFLTIYKNVVDRRLAAKAAGDKVTADGLKITANGTFGKLFNKYSIMYAPELGIRVTLTGQLALLMLIERLELSGVRVVSANTDGIVAQFDPNQEPIYNMVCSWWQRATMLALEFTDYDVLAQRDVNNYFARVRGGKEHGKVKRKGIFARPGLIENKHPDRAICAEAAIKDVLERCPVEQTVRACTDIREFLRVRQVSGGGYYRGQYLGKAVRFYVSTCGTHINNAKGDKVAESDNAMPIMRLPDYLPADIHYDFYIEHANRLVDEVGVNDIPF